MVLTTGPTDVEGPLPIVSRPKDTVEMSIRCVLEDEIFFISRKYFRFSTFYYNYIVVVSMLD